MCRSSFDDKMQLRLTMSEALMDMSGEKDIFNVSRMRFFKVES